jgi:predicted AAA+ superfamily ATPase
VKRKTVEGYFGILEDLLLAFRLPVFSRRARRKSGAHPKFYYFDSGVYRTIRPAGPLDAPQEIDGAALEGLVAQHLRSWADYREIPCRLHYWRTAAGLEVDFVLYGQDTFYGIEVKSTAVIRPKMLNALRSFQKNFPEAGTCFLYRGREQLLIDGILCMPAETFLFQLHPKRPLLQSDQKIGRYR